MRKKTGNALNKTFWKTGKILLREKARLRLWLHKTCSVSTFLRGLSGADFRIELRQNRFCNHNLADKLFFAGDDKNVFVREVVIYRKETPIIYAQARFPSKAIRHLPEIINLGDSPLGIFLQQQGFFYKESMNFTYLKRKTPEFNTISKLARFNESKSLICRKSIFRINNSKAEMVEVFLPGFIEIFGQIKTGKLV